MSEARPIGPEINELLARPDKTLDRWTEDLSRIQKEFGFTALRRPDPLELDAIVSAIRPYRFYLDAFTVAKSIQVFVREYDTSIDALPMPIRTTTESGLAPPFFLLGERLLAGMMESAKRTRVLMKSSKVERRILSLSDYVDSAEHLLDPEKAPGPRFERKSVELGGRTGVIVGMAFHSFTKALWRHRFGVDPSADQLAGTVSVSHKIPKLIATMGLDDFSDRAREILPFHVDPTYGRVDESWLKLADEPDDFGRYAVEVIPESGGTIELTERDAQSEEVDSHASLWLFGGGAIS